MIKLSVIIPMYNVEESIKKCILSVYNQDLHHNEFEIILVDDESPDNSANIASSLISKFSNAKIIHQKNQGLGGARNTGIYNARGKYLLFLDSDDWYLPNTLNELIKIAINNNTEILEFSAQGVCSSGKITYHVIKEDSPVLKGFDYKINYKSINSACNKLYKKDFLVDNDLYFKEKIYGEDLDFNSRTFFFAQKVMASKIIVACFLQSQNSITRSNDKKGKIKYINDLIYILQKFYEFRLNNEDPNKKEQTVYFNEKMTSICTGIFQELFKNNFTFSEVQNIKKKLIRENIYYDSYELLDFKRNIFRKFFMGNNFIIFRFSLKIKTFINI